MLKLITNQLEPFYIYGIYYAINITAFYTVVYVLKSTLNMAKPQYFKAIVAMLFLIIIFQLIKSGIGYVLEYFHLVQAHPELSFVKVMSINLYRFLYFVILGIFFWASGHISYFRRQVIDAEREQLIVNSQKAELEIRLATSRNAYLQQQISPHLLFNTLNFIYSSVYQYSVEGARGVYLLSEIMRFSIDATGEGREINLKDEVEQIQNMIELNGCRYNYPLSLITKFSGDFGNFNIIPLILLTLTENFFKYGDFRDINSPATLSINVHDGKLSYHSKNRIKNNNLHKVGGLGLSNIKIRLDYSYPENYELSIFQEKNEFELTLMINL